MRYLSSQITIIFIASWKQKVWALDKSARPWSFLNTIFELTTTKAKQMQLQMLGQGFRKEVKIKKMSSKLKIAKFFIVYKIHWPMLV